MTVHINAKITENGVKIINKIGGTSNFSKNLRITINKAESNMIYIDDDEKIYRKIEKAVKKSISKKYDFIAKVLYKIIYLTFMTNALLITLIVEKDKGVFSLYRSLKSIAHKEIRKETTDISSIESILEGRG
ncbi:MAG: hypothetical protein MJA82_14930 [Clostridia bacterium]|nr:hypothetical protein [Clostridia bacterium]